MDIIYHGSNAIVDYPYFRKDNIIKDFSWGFYCTRIKDQAEKYPIVNTYNLKDISYLKVKVFKERNNEYLDFIAHCRNGGIHDYDIVESFIDGNSQISFHTIKALERIEFIEYENIEKKSR